jgi:Domain of unknown function (DUF5916)/Carbohydrate family 9 binding domain-like
VIDILTKDRRLLIVTAAVLAGLLGPAGRGRAQTVGSGDDGGHIAPTPALDAHLAAMPLVRTDRIIGGIDLDGHLDEPEWRQVQPATHFIQTEPNEGQAATERTEVYILFDNDALYVGARMWESTGDVKKRLGRRDSFMFDSDWFYISLDTYHGHTTAYQFSVNPAGVKRDEIQGSNGYGRPDASWDAVWDAATSTDSAGWTAEMRIPFSQLRYSRAAQQIWGLQLSRRAIAKQEVSVLAYTPKSQPGGIARYAHIVGLQSLVPGSKLEMLPYVVTKAEYLPAVTGNPFRDGSEMFGGAGLDMKYRLTSSMTLDATLNPDFGQVEVDPAVVNLSAFETSFDEKRPFFVEGADIFRFGEMRMFYSRRIGRSPQGSLPEETAYANKPDNTTILGAAKMTGRTQSGWNLGLVEALTAQEQAPWVDINGLDGTTIVEPRTNYLAARAQKNMREGQTQIGGIFTAVNRDIPDQALADALRSSAYSGGVDFAHEFLDRNWEVNGYFAYGRVNGDPEAMVRAQRSSARYYQRPDADYLTLDSSLTSLGGYAGRIAIRKAAGLHWRGDANISAISPGFEINDLGFQTAADRIGADVNVQYVENTPGRVFRNYRINLRTSRDWNYGHDVVGTSAHLSLNGTLSNYWGGHINYSHSFTSLDDRLTRGGPIAQNLGDDKLEFEVNSDGRKRISGRSQVNFGWGQSGSWSRSISANVGVRPAESWSVSLGPKINRSRTEAQYVGSIEDATATATYGQAYVFAPIDQTTVSMETRLNVNFTPDVSFELYAQPFISTGDYGDLMQLRAPRVFEFDPFTDTSLERSDFNNQSLRGNAVFRWEWRPGSTLFLVWQQRRSDSEVFGDFNLNRDATALFAARPSNVFLVKMNYWLNL